MDLSRQRWARVEQVFSEAVDLSPVDRVACLDRTCSDAPDVRQEIERLLAAHDSAGGFLASLDTDAAAALLNEPGSNGAPETIGAYRIVRRLGGGGMGVVYLAHDPKLERPVALKIVRRTFNLGGASAAALLGEARAASALDHPNIAPIYEFGETSDGRIFIAMAYCEGESLADVIARAPMAPREAVEIGRQIADALAAAHKRGIVHRDIKPANVMISEGSRARLVDFGIAHRAGHDSPHPKGTIGTPAYMSPEQAAGAETNHLTDVWSLGIVLYEMFAGRRPFRGDTSDSVRRSIREDEPTPIRQLRRDVPEALGRLVARCLVKEPSERPSAAAVAADLVASSSTDDASGHPKVDRGSTIRRWQIAVASALAVVVVVASYFVMTRSTGPNPTARRVVVVPLENRTGQSSLDPIGAMTADWVIQGLTNTGVVDVVPTTAALAASRFVTGALGRENAGDRIELLMKETGAGIVVSGAYYQQADSIYLRATINDALRGRVLSALDPIAAPSSRPLVGIEQLRQRVMSALAAYLNPRLGEGSVRLGSAPPKYDAYRLYAEGLELFIARDWRRAIERFRESATEDSSFMVPLLFSALAFTNLGDNAAVDSILVLARPHMARLPEAERLTFDFLEARARGDRVGAYRASQRNPQLWPGGLAHWGLANVAMWVNRPRETVRVSHQLDPERGELRGWLFYWRDLARAHHRLGEYRTELEVARRARELFPDDAVPIGAEVRALAALRRERDLRVLLSEQAPRTPAPSLVWRSAGIELLAHGSTAGGQELVRESINRVSAARSTEPAVRLFLAEGHVVIGERDEAERIVRSVAAEQPNLMTAEGLLGTLAARRGDRTEATAISNKLAARHERYLYGVNTHWRARIASLLGDRDEAVRLLRQAFAEGMEIWDSMHSEPDFAPIRDYPPFRELLRPKQ